MWLWTKSYPLERSKPVPLNWGNISPQEDAALLLGAVCPLQVGWGRCREEVGQHLLSYHFWVPSGLHGRKWSLFPCTFPHWHFHRKATCHSPSILSDEFAQSFEVVWDRKNALHVHFLPWPALLELPLILSFQRATLVTFEQLSSFIYKNDPKTESKNKAYQLTHVVGSCADL